MTLARPREAVVSTVFLRDLAFWTKANRRLALRTLRLMDAIMRDPFKGEGKPEPLRHELAGQWSRRIDREHRLVYEVSGDRVYFLAARYHY
ncbi:MAG: Txe/YoeB family addiction module toxin [Acidobacteria bacterium]|nr:Txe/YoeB family addiction module toxin [Acidobacteriota bacterium]MCY3972160.1 Txe/YoeB family addiction module toxin [Acidobacteriota bacterium]MCY4119403.1 Txe/YoeB family addiction module toxin [Acidobacteriota bacterium]